MELSVMEKLEADLKFFETLDNPVQVAWHKILLLNGFSAESHWHEFGAICAAHPWFSEVKNPYHNAVHTAQVMWCGSVLAPKRMLADNSHWFPKFMLALMFHDISHNGKSNSFKYQLEIIAGEIFEQHLNQNPRLKHIWEVYFATEYGDWKEMIEFVKRLILGTEVTTDVPQNIKDYEETEKHNLLQVLLVLAQEADVLPSALPNVGKQNGELLAQEWENPVMASDQGRLNFLNMIKFVSKSAKAMGIPEMIDEQKKELEKKLV